VWSGQRTLACYSGVVHAQFSEITEPRGHSFNWTHAIPPPALASCAAVHILQTCRHDLPVRPWTWFGLPGRRPSAGRQDSRSTTPAVCPVYATVHGRQPSVSRRRGTNTEQFSSRSDVIKFPAYLQNETEITFILGVVSTVPKAL